MPVWHGLIESLEPEANNANHAAGADAGRAPIRTVGIIQEQHPDRARLFMQWKRMDWPILVDAYNELQVKAVPITLLIDEHGIIRKMKWKRGEPARRLAAFQREPLDAPEPLIHPAPRPDRAALMRISAGPTAESWNAHGLALAKWGDERDLTEAVESLRRASTHAPDNGRFAFQLGAALRARYDSAHRMPGDFQAAVDAWSAALDNDPNQYIWRRRIEQYGPRLAKPYPFYDWVQRARDEISARGETPLPFAVALHGAEVARPAPRFEADRGAEAGIDPDPDRRIHLDQLLVSVESTVVPAHATPGSVVRVHLALRPTETTKAYWNNEAEPLRVWITPRDGWEVDRRMATWKDVTAEVSRETRTAEFEVAIPDDASPGPHVIRAYALYNVCVGVDGVCLYRRQDITIPITVRSSNAPRRPPAP